MMESLEHLGANRENLVVESRHSQGTPAVGKCHRLENQESPVAECPALVVERQESPVAERPALVVVVVERQDLENLEAQVQRGTRAEKPA